MPHLFARIALVMTLSLAVVVVANTCRFSFEFFKSEFEHGYIGRNDFDNNMLASQLADDDDEVEMEDDDSVEMEDDDGIENLNYII
jgi:hypothetical protein